VAVGRADGGLGAPGAHLDGATADALARELLTTTDGRTALIVTHRPDQTPGLPVVRLHAARAAACAATP